MAYRNKPELFLLIVLRLSITIQRTPDESAMIDAHRSSFLAGYSEITVLQPPQSGCLLKRDRIGP
jgi:hypothetical protein